MISVFLKFVAFVLLLNNTIYSVKSEAKDVIKMQKPLLSYDKRAQHKDEVIHTALELSKAKFGDYEFTEVDVEMSTGRALKELQAGKYINVFIASADPTWERDAKAIKVPIRLGMLSYRLLLIRKQDADVFAKLTTRNDLAQFFAGLQPHWSTTNVFKLHNLNVIHGHEFDSLFLMLRKKRFDYIPRAVYEAFDELEQRSELQQDIVIAPQIALRIPSATYIYVTPDEPGIYQRLSFGMTQLQQSGQLRQIFDKYYADEFRRAELDKRTIIELENPLFSSN